MKKVLLYGLLLLTQGLCAQVHTCPMRIVPGDPRNNGREQEMMQEDRQRRIAEAQNETMHTPGICTRTLPPRVLVIMAQFSNYDFTTDKAHADSLFNAVLPMHSSMGHRYGEREVEHGSVASYFNDQSRGDYRPQFDVVGPITLSKGYNKYKNSEFNLVQEACSLVNDSVDFTRFDADADGYIDLVFVYFAGFGSNDGTYIDERFGLDVNNLVWPHYRGDKSTAAVYDGKKLRAYECSNELDGYLSVPDTLVASGCGVLVHEFSHGLGLPDVYAGSGANQKSYMGSWDLMDYGCYGVETFVPTSYTGWERWFMGWSEPQWMNEAKDVTLRPISESGDFGVITSNGQPCDSFNTSTYWIVENRQKAGWDRSVSNSGLILYQLKYHNGWKGNSVNSETDMCYVLKPADGTLRNPNGAVGKASDCYPYGALDSIKVVTSYPITTIKQETNGDITFQVCGGATSTNLIREDNNPAYPTKIYQNGSIYIRRGNKLYLITGHETHIL